MTLDKLVTIELDKERHLRLTMKGMIEFNKITGRNMLKGLKLKELSLEDFAALLWACLIHEDSNLTLDDVLSLIDLQNLLEVVEVVTDCINQSLAEVKKDKSPLVGKSRPG